MYWLSFIFSTYTLIPDIASSRPASLEAVKLVQSTDAGPMYRSIRYTSYLRWLELIWFISSYGESMFAAILTNVKSILERQRHTNTVDDYLDGFFRRRQNVRWSSRVRWSGWTLQRLIKSRKIFVPSNNMPLLSFKPIQQKRRSSNSICFWGRPLARFALLTGFSFNLVSFLDVLFPRLFEFVGFIGPGGPENQIVLPLWSTRFCIPSW